eukprot:5531943-Ditylum_brightwellii.AAC.1
MNTIDTAKEDEKPSSCLNGSPKAKIEGKDETTESKGAEDKLDLKSKTSEGATMNKTAFEEAKEQGRAKEDDQRDPSSTDNPTTGN